MRILEQVVFDINWSQADIEEALEAIGKRPDILRGTPVYSDELVAEIQAYLEGTGRSRSLDQVCTMLGASSTEIWDCCRKELHQAPSFASGVARFSPELIEEIRGALPLMRDRKEDAPARPGKSAGEVCAILGIDALKLASLHHFAAVRQPHPVVGYDGSVIAELKSALAMETATYKKEEA